MAGPSLWSARENYDDVWSRGHLCPKGTSLAALHDDPDRIGQPMIKVDGQWREVSWDAAFRRCTELLTPVIEKYGIGAVTAYTGNPLAHSFSLARYAGVLMGMSGMPVTYSPGTVDQWPKNLSSYLMYGLWWNFPAPDIERTDLLVIMGANPAASQGSLLAAPNVMGLIEGIRKRGKVIVIDPVRTLTAARADEWLPIVPGTDAALLLAVAHTLFDEGLINPGPHVDGVDTMRAAVADWPPERVSAVTGIDEDRIRRLARELAGTERSVVYGRIGLCNQEFGSPSRSRTPSSPASSRCRTAGGTASRAPACRWPTAHRARTPMCCPRRRSSTSPPATGCSTASWSRSSTSRPGSHRSDHGSMGRLVHWRSGRSAERNHPPAAPVPPSVGMV